MAWLNGPERSTETGLLFLQGLCGSLRISGLVCTMIYVLLRARGGFLWGRRRRVILLSSLAWLLPQSLFLLPMVVVLFIGEREGATIRTTWGQDGTVDKALSLPVWVTAIGRSFRTSDQASLKLLRLYREKTFLLMAEVESVMMLVLPMRERFPLMNLPGCLVAIIFVAALLMLPIGVVLFARSLIRIFSAPGDQSIREKGYPFARYLLLSSMAAVGGFNIGVHAGIRNFATLAFLLFWVGVFGVTISLFVAFFGFVRGTDMSLFAWPMLFAMMGMTGHEMKYGSSRLIELVGPRIEDVAKFHLFNLYLNIPLIFLFSVLVGLYRCRWLLRPFRVKDIFNPTFPNRLRRRLAFLAVTACLPLGGFLVPVWIRLRARMEEHPLPA